MDADMLNLANFIASELRAQMIPNVQLYRTGNMQASVVPVVIEEDYIDIVIATDYASYTNTRGRMAGWIDKTIDRCCRCYCENNGVENTAITGFITYE